MTTNSTPSNNKLIHWRMKNALLFGVFIGTGIAYGFTKTVFSPNWHEPQAQSQPIGRAEYEQLKDGITITEARAIIFSTRGIEVSRSGTTATYVWENPDGSKITVTFEGDKLKSKEQSGLQ